MKPTVDMSQKTPVVTVTEPIMVESKPAKRSWAMNLGICMLGSLLTVIAVIVLLTFVQVMNHRHANDKSNSFNLMKNADSQGWTQGYMSADINYHLAELDETIKETLVVTDNEEEIVTKDARIIFDYQNGFAVTHISRRDAKSSESVCFVRTFNPPSKGINKIKEIVGNGVKDEFVTRDIKEELYVPTGETFDRSLLSERAAAMCEKSRMVRVEKSDGLEKRSVRDGSLMERRQKRQDIIECGIPGVQGYGCTIFCESETISQSVLTCSNPGVLNFFFGDGSGSGCTYKIKISEVPICVLQCNCYGDGTTPGPTTAGPTMPSTTTAGPTINTPP